MNSTVNDDSSNADRQAVLDHYSRLQRMEETAFLILQVGGGQVLLPILVLTILFSRKISRHAIFINFCTSWIISSIFYSLLVYRGRSTPNALSLEPSAEHCLLQSALLNGVQTLTACTTLALIVHLFLTLRVCLMENHSDKNIFVPKTWNFILLTFPQLAFIASSVATAIIGNRPMVQDGQAIPNTTLAVPTVFYCVILQNADFNNSLDPGFKFLRVMYSITITISIVCFIFEVWVAIMVYRHRMKLSQIRDQGWLKMFLRVVLFSFYRMVAACLNFAIIAQPDEILLVGLSKDNLYNGPIDFVQALLPLVAFLIFGTERQFLEIWCFWRRWKRPALTHQRTVESQDCNSKAETESQTATQTVC